MNILLFLGECTLPTLKYGGTERVVWDLAESLGKKGHRVSIVAGKNSTCPFATIIPFSPEKELVDHVPNNADIVHFQFVPNKETLERLSIPYVMTSHAHFDFANHSPSNIIFVSQQHARNYGRETFVHNGLNFTRFPKPNLTASRKGFHFLGRANWSVKNLPDACRIASNSDETLQVLGGDRWTFTNLKRIPFHLINPRISFHGMADDKTKACVLNQSKALVFPVLWEEPFGLAIIESLYMGCAVFGTERGALPELVTPEVGCLDNDVSALCKKIANFDYNQKRCHEYAAANFTSDVTCDNYISKYEAVLNGEELF